LLNKNEFLYTYHQSYGTDNNLKPLECFFKNEDKKGLDIFLKHVYNNKRVFSFADVPTT